MITMSALCDDNMKHCVITMSALCDDNTEALCDNNVCIM